MIRNADRVSAHKTIDGVRIQAKAGNGVTAFIASTLPEVHYLAHSGMVEEGLVKDVCISIGWPDLYLEKNISKC